MPTFSLESRRRVAFGLFVGLVLAGVGAGASATVGAASPALAHDYVVSSTPESGETVTEPIQTVSITFSDDLIVLGDNTKITVTDADDGHHESGCVSVDGSTVTTDVSLGEAGVYTVSWQVVSSDGHNTYNTYTFEWQPEMPTATTIAKTASPACGDAWSGSVQPTTPAQDAPTGAVSPSATASESGALPQASLPEPTMTILNAAPAGQTGESPLSVPLLIAAMVGVLAALSAIVVVVMRRMRRS